MAQLINMAITDNEGNIEKELEGNFAPIMPIAYGIGEDKLPWVTSIDEYGNTYINRTQAEHLIKELETLSASVPPEHQPTIRNLLAALKGIEVHTLIAFYGD
jgi:hypothetical protein